MRGLIGVAGARRVVVESAKVSCTPHEVIASLVATDAFVSSRCTSFANGPGAQP